MTTKETALFQSISEGATQEGAGWLHELATPGRSTNGVLGSLVKKGLVKTTKEKRGTWVTLTEADISVPMPE